MGGLVHVPGSVSGYAIPGVSLLTLTRCLASYSLGMDYVKNVVSPIKQVAPRDTLRSFQDDYGNITADVIHLAGEVHYERKPVSLQFTAPYHHTHFFLSRAAFVLRLRLTETSSRVLYFSMCAQRIRCMNLVPNSRLG